MRVRLFDFVKEETGYGLQTARMGTECDSDRSEGKGDWYYTTIRRVRGDFKSGVGQPDSEGKDE